MKRFMALLMVLVMAGFLSLAGCKKETTPKPATSAATAKPVVYYCPAHPDKLSTTKGAKCPVCMKEMVPKPAATRPAT